MSAPQFEAVTEPLAPQLAGDPHDDDAQIIDDFFEPTSGPADVTGAKVDFHDHSLTPPKRPTRIQSGFQAIDANTTYAVQIQPFDPNRERIVIRFTSLAATPDTYVYVADEANKLTLVAATSGQAGRIPHGSDLTLEGHTGPVFVTFGTGSGYVSWWAVTT
jgi:hypothetical protein